MPSAKDLVAHSTTATVALRSESELLHSRLGWRTSQPPRHLAPSRSGRRPGLFRGPTPLSVWDGIFLSWRNQIRAVSLKWAAQTSHGRKPSSSGVNLLGFEVPVGCVKDLGQVLDP